MASHIVLHLYILLSTVMLTPIYDAPAQWTHPVTYSGWTYDHHACSDALIDKMDGLELYPRGSSEGFEAMRKPLIPFAQAYFAQPGSLLGHVLFEGGDGCRSYYPQVGYFFVRNPSERSTTSFQKTTDIPPVMARLEEGGTIDVDGFTVRVIHRGLVAIYEVVYRHKESVSPRPVRREVMKCFAYTKHAKL